MGKTWDDDPEASHPPRRRRRVPSYGQGSRMQELMDVLTADTIRTHQGATAAVDALYPDVPLKPKSELVFNAHRALSRGDLAAAERLAHDFIVGPGRPSTLPPEPRRPWWRRLWQSDFAMGWVFAGFALAALLTATEVWA